MHYLNDFSDERLKGSCAHCGTGIDDIKSSMDHVPSKCLLRKPYPDNLPGVRTCVKCNTEYSKDEEYFSVFLQCVLIGSTDPNDHRDPRIREALRRSRKLRERIERSRSEVEEGENSRIIWEPEYQRVNNVILKNARGHALYEFGEHQEMAPAYVWATPLCALPDMRLRDFTDAKTYDVAEWPEVGSRAMQRAILGCDTRDGWVIVQDRIYRYEVRQDAGVRARSVLAEYLATEVYWPVDRNRLDA